MRGHTTAVDYRTSLGGDVALFPVDIDLPSFSPLGTTDRVVFALKLISGEIVGETTRASSEEMVVSLPELSPTFKLLAQLAMIEQTPEDDRWPDAVWPDAQAFEDAQTFIRRLPLHLIPLPEISLADDGEINFLWQSDGVHVDLGFYGTGTCSYFARGEDGRRIHGEDAPAPEGLPLEITTLLTA